MATLFDVVDIYCERTGPGFWNEPLNALSNLAFFLAAWHLWKRYKAKNTQDSEALLLIFLIGLVGLGSLLFHTLATEIAMLSDVIPIGLFVCGYLWISLKRLLAWSALKRLSALAIFIVITAWLMRLPPEQSFNDSAGYFPCVVFLLLTGAALAGRHHPFHSRFRQAALLLILSLTFRTVDMAVCPMLPFGVHFIWHLCNGLLLYLLTLVILDSPRLQRVGDPLH